MVFPQQQGGALSLACGPYPSTRSSPMNGTKLLRPRVMPFSCGLALALVVGCAGPATRQLQKPAPDDEVSVGYGTQQKSNLTAAITSISPTEAETRVARGEDLLRARVPGLEVLPLRDGSCTLRIRGHHGLRGSVAADEPLLVIDDIPALGSAGALLASLEPQDIARIDVLKDAGATAVYGSRGANGVIIITTKRGR